MAEEYISKNDILDHIKDVYEQAFISLETRQMVSAFKAYVSNLPTADVVEVVRCSTCERCKILADEFDNDWYFCMRDYDVEVSANHFCGYGKRKPNLSTIPTGLERSDT